MYNSYNGAKHLYKFAECDTCCLADAIGLTVLHNRNITRFPRYRIMFKSKQKI